MTLLSLLSSTTLGVSVLQSTAGINPDALLFPSRPGTIVAVDSYQTLEEALTGTPAPEEITRDLRLVNVEYYSFDNRLHWGQIIVHKELAGNIKAIFREIKRIQFPVASITPIPFDLPNGTTSMNRTGNNNSYGFQYRPIATYRTPKLSNHSYGIAIDINPLQNPAILRDGTALPEGACYNPEVPGTIIAGSPIVRLFKQYGWTWGGDWRVPKDYMHFEKMTGSVQTFILRERRQ